MSISSQPNTWCLGFGTEKIDNLFSLPGISGAYVAVRESQTIDTKSAKEWNIKDGKPKEGNA